MISLTSIEILAAVQRSLETHVLPAVVDEFARVQVVAAIRALEQVSDRLEHGDHLAAANAQLAAGVTALADRMREVHPRAAGALGAVVAADPDDVGPRARSRQLLDDLHRLASELESEAAEEAADVRRLLQDHASTVAGADARWISDEAIRSLQ